MGYMRHNPSNPATNVLPFVPFKGPPIKVQPYIGDMGSSKPGSQKVMQTSCDGSVKSYDLASTPVVNGKSDIYKECGCGSLTWKHCAFS